MEGVAGKQLSLTFFVHLQSVFDNYQVLGYSVIPQLN
jgi:hypothetical protein